MGKCPIKKERTEMIISGNKINKNINYINRHNFKYSVETINNQEMKDQKYLYQDHSAEQLETYSYIRGIGAYKPHFAGVPQNYYPLKCRQIIMAIIILVLVIGGVLGILIGFIKWVENAGLQGYIIAWVAVFIAFIVALLILFYIGGKQRRRLEKQLIAENNRRQMQMIKNKR